MKRLTFNEFIDNKALESFSYRVLNDRIHNGEYNFIDCTGEDDIKAVIKEAEERSAMMLISTALHLWRLYEGDGHGQSLRSSGAEEI